MMCREALDGHHGLLSRQGSFLDAVAAQHSSISPDRLGEESDGELTEEDHDRARHVDSDFEDDLLRVQLPAVLRSAWWPLFSCLASRPPSWPIMV